jgi:hypothetical protein
LIPAAVSHAGTNAAMPRAGSPPTRRGCSNAASRAPTALGLCPARGRQLLTRKDISLRERTPLADALQNRRQIGQVLALDVEGLDLSLTRLSWLGTGPVAATHASVKGELEKLAFLAATLFTTGHGGQAAAGSGSRS